MKRVRDEAHRFAITYHRELRGKAMTASALDDIPGVGPKRKKALLKAFGSVKRLREATVDEIAAVPGVPREVAETVHAFLDAEPRASGVDRSAAPAVVVVEAVLFPGSGCERPVRILGRGRRHVSRLQGSAPQCGQAPSARPARPASRHPTLADNGNTNGGRPSMVLS